MNIKTKHEFLMFKLKGPEGFLGSIDFYIDDRVLVSIGNIDTVILDGDRLGNRSKSKICEANTNHV